MSMTLTQEQLESQKSEAPGSDLEVAIVKLLIHVGFQHKRIAALFDCNQGRIAEIATKKKAPGVGFRFRVVDGSDGAEWPLDAPQGGTPAAVKVKPLKWLEVPALNGGRKLLAFDLHSREHARLDLKGHTDDEIEDFKARRQQAYDRSVLSAIEVTPPAPKVTEATTALMQIAALAREARPAHHASTLDKIEKIAITAAQEAGISEWQYAGPDGRWHDIDERGVDGMRGRGIPVRRNPLLAPKVTEDATVAARFARLHGIVSRILWMEVGMPAFGNPQTKQALIDLCEYLFAAGIDAALEAGKQYPTTTADEADPDRLFERAYAEVAGTVPPAD